MKLYRLVDSLRDVPANTPGVKYIESYGVEVVPDYEAAMKSYWLAYEFDPNDDEAAVKDAVDAALQEDTDVA
jgi:hypothetical protein